MYNTKILVMSAIAIVVVGLFSGMFTIFNELNFNEPSEYQRNYNFDVAIGNLAQPRTPTQYDIYVGSVSDGLNEYSVYESRTLVTNDFSKLFVGGKI